MSAKTAATAVQMTGVRKRFGDVPALRDGSLNIRVGEVHGLVGANGAGKSTMIKILAGALRPDAGQINIGGTTFSALDERRAYDLGLRFIHQDVGVVGRMTVAENIFLGTGGPSWGPFVQPTRMRMKAREILHGIVNVDPTAKMDSLSLSQRWLVAIARACMGNSKLVVMDEPTVALSKPEVDRVFDVVRKMRARGISVLFVSHRLPEVLELCDRVTVMRDGAVVATHDVSALSADALVELIAGEKLGDADAPQAASPGHLHADPVLSVRGLQGGPLKSVDFDVHPGEVVGLAGLVGSGRTSVLEQVFGAHRSTGGEIWVDGRQVRVRTTHDAVVAGLALIPEDRLASGLVGNRTIRENASIAYLNRFRAGRLPIPSRRKERANALSHIKDLAIKCTGPEQIVRELSGGNQQKVLVSRWLGGDNLRVLMLDEPTKGVDAMGKADLYRVIRSLASAGVAVVVVSSDLEELSAICHRAVVVVEGRTVANLQAPLSEQAVLEACYAAAEYVAGESLPVAELVS